MLSSKAALLTPSLLVRKLRFRDDKKFAQGKQRIWSCGARIWKDDLLALNLLLIPCIMCLPRPWALVRQVGLTPEAIDLGAVYAAMGSPGGAVVQNLPANTGDTGDMGSIPERGRAPGRGNGNPFQYSCLRIPGTEEPGGLQSVGLQRDYRATEHCTVCVWLGARERVWT